MARSRTGAFAPFLLVAASICWGLSTVMSKALLDPLSPQILLVLQLLPCVVVLWTCMALFRSHLPHARLLWISPALGVLNPGVSYSLSLVGLDRVPASVASMLWSTEPLMILALAAFILREPLTGRLIAVIASGFVGATLAAGALYTDRVAPDVIGLSLVLCAVFLCAIYTVLSRKLGVEVAPLPLLTVQMSAGLVWSVVAFAATDPSGTVDQLQSLPIRQALAAGLTGVIYYALAYWLYLVALRQVSAAVAGSSFNVIPLVAVSAAFIFLGERLEPSQLAGGALILLSVVLLFRCNPRQPVSAG